MLNHTMNGRRHGRGLPLLLCGLLFVVCHFSTAQYNLVQNHSFEEADSCGASLGFNPGPTHWFSAGVTPDHMLRCVPTGSMNAVPWNLYTYQEPQDGDAYIGVITRYHSVNSREYAMTQLIEPLVIGDTYDVSFHANASFGGNLIYPIYWLATNNIGVLFTMEPRPWVSGDPDPIPLNYAHIHHPEIISDTVGWTLVSGTFVADSVYQYLMIGNHFDDVNTDTLHLGTPGSTAVWYPRAYTLIDNVSVARRATGIAENSLVGIRVYPNPAVDGLSISDLPAGSVITIHDALGRRKWESGITDGVKTLDVATWARGTYVLRVQANGRDAMFKFALIDR